MIRRIELHNFATHENTEAEFGNGKNVIIGATGSGKTNLLLAIDFAFTGEVPGANLSELIADDANAAEVLLDYLDARTGQNYRIHRTLTRETNTITHESQLKNLDTNETVNKPGPVQKTLEALGVISSTYRHVVHVPQGNFADLLDETQERKNSLDRLFQISQLENAHQELGRQEGPIRQIEMRKQNKLREKSGLEAAASRLEDEKRHFETLKNEKQKKQLKVDESITERDKLQNMLEPNSRILETLRKNDEKLRITEETVKSCKSQIETALSQMRTLLPADECNTIEKKTSAEINVYLKSLRSSLVAKQALEKSLNETQRENLGRVSTTKSEINGANEERKTNLNQISTIQNYLEGKGEQPQIQCDKCGSLLTKEQWNGHIQEKRKSIEDLDARIAKLTKQLETENQEVSTTDEKLSEIRTRTRNIETATLLVEQIASQRQRSEAAITSIKPLLDQRMSLMTELRQLLKAEPALEDQEVVKQAMLLQEKLKLIAGEILNLTKDLRSYDENYLKPQEKRVTEAQEAKKKLEKLEPEIRLDESKISLLQAIRTSLREIQPAVRRAFVSRITQSANDYLKRLYGGAEIENFELTEDYQFIVTRAGHKRHASRLSGGQQVLASMAFLLALSEVLSQLDFLILDEPTTHLDENRRKELVTVLENLRRVPQLIIVDHHPELLEAADTRFRVSLTPNGLSKLDLIEA